MAQQHGKNGAADAEMQYSLLVHTKESSIL
jgi:hypothetical protein